MRGLVAVNTFGWRPEGIAFRGMLAVMGSRPMQALDTITGWLPRMTATRFGVGRRLDAKDRRTFRRGMDRRGRRSFHRYMRSVRTHDYTTVDRAVNVGRATVAGQHNDPLGFHRWAERFPDLTRLEIDGGNHFPMCDDPGLVADTIRSWEPRR